MKKRIKLNSGAIWLIGIVLLTLALLTLKLTEVVSFSWWIVFLPILFWAGLILVLGMTWIVLYLIKVIRDNKNLFIEYVPDEEDGNSDGNG